MTIPTRKAARALRDGGIDAVAALDFALQEALAGLEPEQAAALKRIVGDAMGEVIDKVINPAIKAYPELDPDDAAWRAVVRERVILRGAQYADDKVASVDEPFSRLRMGGPDPERT